MRDVEEFGARYGLELYRVDGTIRRRWARLRYLSNYPRSGPTLLFRSSQNPNSLT